MKSTHEALCRSNRPHGHAPPPSPEAVAGPLFAGGCVGDQDLYTHCVMHSAIQRDMRIELGTGGKIIGTRKVSPNGQVSGLKEFAGRELLIVLPGEETAESSSGFNPYLKGLEEIIKEQVDQALEQYAALQKAYTAPMEVATEFLGGKKAKGEKKEP